MVGSKCTGIWIEAEQETGGVRSGPDDAMWVAGNLHQGRPGLQAWHSERSNVAISRIETPQVVIAAFREPHHVLRVDCYPVGVERLHAFPRRERVLLNLARTCIKLTQRVSVQLGEPYIALAI